ncbi:hypothetical protein BaRGS_00027073, partial [Batillaria attramentaria]
MERSGKLKTRALWQRAVTVSKTAAKGISDGDTTANGSGSGVGGGVCIGSGGSGTMLKNRTSFHNLATSLLDQRN